MIRFKRITAKNFLSYGNVPTVIELDKNKSTLLTGSNGSGKCVEKSTMIEISFLDEEVQRYWEDFLKTK